MPIIHRKVGHSRTGSGQARTGSIQVFLHCKVSLGMFSSERGISVVLPSGQKIVAFVDKRDVNVGRDPRPGEEIDGLVKVSVVTESRQSIVVDLPQPAISQGPRIEVPPRMLQIA